MKSNMMRKRALQQEVCECCTTPGCVCDEHNLEVKNLDIPKKAHPFKDNGWYERKKSEYTQILAEQGGSAPLKSLNDGPASLTIPEFEKMGFYVGFDSSLKGWRVYLKAPHKEATSKEYERDKTYQDKGGETDLNISIESAISPAKGVLDYIKQKRIALEQLLQTRGEAAVASKAAKDLAETVPGVANTNTSMLGGVIAKYLIQLTQKAKGQKVTPAFNDNQFLQEIQPILERKQASMNSTAAKNLKDYTEEELEELEQDDAEEKKTKTKMKSPKTAAEGGAEDEEETEEQTSVDSSVVALLDSCKNEWTNLGDPVNPQTWPKEIERAILSLNDAIIKAIESTQEKLIEGEFYSKNVDEGVSSGGGSSMMNDLNTAPSDEGMENEEAPSLLEEESLNEVEANKKSSKTAAVDVTSTETKKALKFVEDLQDKIATMFFDYKKAVESANNSSLIKSAGEDLVRLKTKLGEIEKVISKQLTVLSEAEEAIDEKQKETSKKAAFEGEPKAVREEAEKIVKALKGKKGIDDPYAVALSQARKTVGKKSMFMGLSLASEE